jgi:hypothetical protein
MAIILKVLETKSDENDLLFRLIARGRQADIPYYFSVDTYDLEKGWVIFTRLDCAPAPAFRVGVAGKNLIISTRDEHHLKGFLKDWNLDFQEKGTFEAASPDVAHAHLSEMRKKVVSESKRKSMLAELQKRVKELHERESNELLKRCSS